MKHDNAIREREEKHAQDLAKLSEEKHLVEANLEKAAKPNRKKRPAKSASSSVPRPKKTCCGKASKNNVGNKSKVSKHMVQRLWFECESRPTRSHVLVVASLELLDFFQVSSSHNNNNEISIGKKEVSDNIV